MITEKAYAKINPALDVLGRYPNGYHEVRMILQTVDLYDTLTFEPGGEEIRLLIEGGEDSSEVLSAGPDNLICRSAAALLDRCGISRRGVTIRLEKRIPIAAGMAGGSSDAAATLRGLNRLFSLGLTPEDLCDIGVGIGSDIPYCIHGGTMLAEGIGGNLTGLSDMPDLLLAIAKPPRGVSTAEVYHDLDAVFDSVRHPDVPGMCDALKAGDRDGILRRLGNVLEEVTIPRCPEVGRIKQIFLEAGAQATLMSGSGPSVFAVFAQEDRAAQALEEMRSAGLAREIFLTRTIRPKYLFS